MNKSSIEAQYKAILEKVWDVDLKGIEDKFSGVFLPYAFDEYNNASLKVMLVGRETAHWNTKNKLNKLNRIVEKIDTNKLDEIIKDAYERYSWHLKAGSGGELKTKHRSHFKRYYQKLYKELNIPPSGMIYANLLAWDYNGKSPLNLPKEVREQIEQLSRELLAIQIKAFNPDVVIFATGVYKVDPIIRTLMTDYFNGYKTKHLVSRKLWQFKGNDSSKTRFFRIAHPRAQGGHAQYREEVIQRIKRGTKWCERFELE